MKFHLESAEILVPDGMPIANALARTTHLAVGAHQDDIEIMALDGILKCYQRNDQWFTGVVMTNGSGSPRAGLYQDYSDEQMQAIRRQEQKKAAVIGDYAAQILLDYPSKAIKDPANMDSVDDITLIVKAAHPEIVYTHNLTDRHETHIGVAIKVIEALRRLPKEDRPRSLYGCEVWRDLDWLVDADKIAFDVSAHENLQSALLGVFDSQISGGKRYDLATMGRRRANATYHASHDTDTATGLIFAMDLTPLIIDSTRSIQGFAKKLISRFDEEVSSRLAPFV